MKLSTKFVTFALVVILSLNLVHSEERWSRQLPLEEQPSSVATQAATGNDWVPLSEPCPTCKLGADRTENGKSLRFYEDNAPAAQQQYQFFEQPPFNNRFNHQQQSGALDVFPPQAQHVNNLQPAPAFQFIPKQPVPQSKQIPVFVEQHQNKPFAEPLIQHQRPYQFMEEMHKQQPHFMTNYQPQQVVQTQQHHQFGPPPPQFHTAQNVPQYHRPQNQAPQFQGPPPANAPIFQQAPPAAPPQFVQQQNQNVQPFPPQNPEEEVQLLYVPYETLYNQQGQPQQGLEGLGQPGRFNQQQSRYNVLHQPVSASLINDFYSENTVPAGPRPTTTQRPATRRTTPITTTTLRPYSTTPFSFYLTKPTNPPQFSQKPKAHQPPLSMFMLDKYDGKVSEKDVLKTLRTSNNIDVRDSVEKNSPKIFIGPSGMSAPKGYSKFELPYLSSIENNRHERRIEELPFFVAPLSYKTPPGFSKIPLPAPHVGSVVVNQPENEIDDQEEAHVITKEDILFNRPSEVSSHPNRPFIDSTKDRQRITLSAGVNYKPHSTFMQNFTVPSKEPSYNNFNNQNDDYQFSTLKPYSAITTAAPEYPSRSVFTTEYPTRSTYTTPRPTPYIATTTRQPITRQPATRQPVTRQPTTRAPYRPQPTFEPTFEPTYKPQFGDFEDQKTVNEEYFNYEKTHKKPVKGHYSFSFGDDVKKPDTDFTFKKTPEHNFEDNFTTKQPRIKEQTVRFSTTPAPQEQEFNSPTGRPQFSYQTTNSPYSSNFDYAPTISTIAQQSDNFPPQISTTRDYNQGNFVNDFRSSVGPQDDYTNRFRLGGDQEKLVAQTESPENVYRQEQEILESLAPTVAPTDDSEYNLPSELPPINANLPGLVNSLMEEKWMVKNEFPGSEVTTRKPVTRGRRPVVSSTYRASAPTTESSVDNTRRTVERTRRPTVYSARTESSNTVTQSPRTRTTVNRNPNKVRYNPSGEERKQFRSRTRAPSTKVVKAEDNIDFQRDVLNQNYPTAAPHLLRPLTTTTEKPTVDEIQPYTPEVQADFTSPPKEEQYLQEVITSQEEYNRVPVIPENTEVIPLGGNVFTEQDETFQKYNSPSQAPLFFDVVTTTSTTQSPFKAKNHKYSQNFGGLLEPMQIPHQHPTLKQKPSIKSAGKYQYSSHNFDEDITTNSYNRVSSRVPLTENQEAKKNPLPRRRPSIYSTTSEPPPATTDIEQQQEVTVKDTTTRPKLTTRKEGGVVVKKIRGRVRKPYAATTESVDAENYDYVPKTSTRRVATPTIRSRSSYNSNRSSQRGTTTPSSNARDDTTDSRPRFRIRENTPRFKLEQQESQWSPRLNQNSFQPLGDEEKINFNKKHLAIEDGQEIITATPDVDTPETYLLNVSASMSPTKEAPANVTSVVETEIDGKKTEKSEFEPDFAKLIKDVMTEIDTEEEKPLKETKAEKKATGTDKKQQQGRRGVWKRVRVRPADSFETAESQNIGNHFFNNLSFDDKKTLAETKEAKAVAEASEEDETMQHSDVEVVPQKVVTEKPEPEVFTTQMPEIEIKEIVTEAPVVQTTTTTTTMAPTTEKVEINEKLTKLMPINDDEMPMFQIEHLFKSKQENDTVAEVEAIPTTTTRGIFKEAQKALTELFSFDDDEEEIEDSATKMAYHSINRETTEEFITTSALPPTDLPAALEPVKKDEKTKPVVLATSQSTEVSHETEICYRGRCIKTEEKNKKK